MAYKRRGLPSEGETVLCTVKRIVKNSVFVELDEFENVEGIIHASEVAAGRIRTIFDYVREGKKSICKVLRQNHEHHSVDLSLRRVSDIQRQKKMEELKKEQKAEKVLEVIAKEMTMQPAELYKTAGIRLVEEFGTLSAGFDEIAKIGEAALKTLNIDKKVATTIVSFVKQRIKPPEVKITRIITISSREPNGIDNIKIVLKNVEETAKKQKKEIEIKFLGSPRYRLQLRAEDYKTAEATMKELETRMITDAKKHKTDVAIDKEKTA